MSRETRGNCPACGHVESSYDDWESLGYLYEGPSRETPKRLWRCRHCRVVMTDEAFTVDTTARIGDTTDHKM